MRINKELYIIVLLSLLSIVVAVYFGFTYKDQQDIIGLILTVVPISITAIIWSLSTGKYLNKDIATVIEKPDIVVKGENVKSMKAANERNTSSDDEDSEIIWHLIQEKIKSFNERQPKEYTYEDSIALRRGDVFRVFEITENRLLKEIGNLSRRANINLIIGGIIALTGIAGLTIFIFSTSHDVRFMKVVPLVTYWIVRLSLIVFIEIFAFFFLRIYKILITSIQYYQDELTSIESRKTALLFSILQNNEKSTCESISCLLGIDRNFKMDINQTTVELEKLKAENSFIRSQMDSIIEVFKSVCPFKAKESKMEQE